MHQKITQLRDHVIICGYGRMGQILAQRVYEAGLDFIVLDINEERIREATEHGYLTHLGNAEDEETLVWAGVERADSLVLNPHKWLGAVFDCSLFYLRDPEHLVRVMSTNPSYLQTAADGEVKTYRDWGIPLGRRFRGLKLWFLLRSEGAEGLRARLRRDLENARWLAEQVDAAPGWRRLAPVPLQTVCVRHEPAGLSGEALDAHTLAWANAVNASGAAYLTPAKLPDGWMVRVSIGALPTERDDVAALWAAMREAAEASAGLS
jgi:aromatic-L-amino-acid decarboxylase